MVQFSGIAEAGLKTHHVVRGFSNPTAEPSMQVIARTQIPTMHTILHGTDAEVRRSLRAPTRFALLHECAHPLRPVVGREQGVELCALLLQPVR